MGQGEGQGQPRNAHICIHDHHMPALGVGICCPGLCCKAHADTAQHCGRSLQAIVTLQHIATPQACHSSCLRGGESLSRPLLRGSPLSSPGRSQDPLERGLSPGGSPQPPRSKEAPLLPQPSSLCRLLSWDFCVRASMAFRRQWSCTLEASAQRRQHRAAAKPLLGIMMWCCLLHTAVSPPAAST